MKKYIIPEIKLSHFESESVVTQSGGQQTALDQAKIAAQNITDSKKTFTVIF